MKDPPQKKFVVKLKGTSFLVPKNDISLLFELLNMILFDKEFLGKQILYTKNIAT
jgi:hypothetical protein